MRARSRRRAGAVLAALAVAVTAACGVPTDDAPRVLEPREVPFASPQDSAVPDPAGERRVGLYFVRDDRVVPTARRVEGPTPTEDLVRLLFRGPAPEEQDAGLISVIPATLTLEDVRVQDGTAVLTLSGPSSEVQRTPPLAYAQIVATLAPSRVEGVRFRLDGADLRVPRGDGSLSAAPLSRRDYAELLAPPPAAATPPAAPARTSVPSPAA